MSRWYHGWNVLAAGLWFQAFTFGIGFFCFTFYIDPWRAEFDVSRGDVMAVFVLIQVAMGLAAPVAGRAVDRLSIRSLVVTGLVCFSAALFVASFAQALWQITIVYGCLFVTGALLAGPLPAQTLAARWFVQRRGFAIGLVTVGTSLGGFLMPILVTELFALEGWRVANRWLAGLTLVAVVPIAWLIIREAPGSFEAHGEVHPEWRVSQVLSLPAFWVIVLAYVALMSSSGAVQQNFAPIALDLGIEAAEAAYLVSLFAVAMIGGKVFFGAMSDRFDQRALFTLAALFLALSQWLLLASDGLLGLALASVALGFAAGGFLPLLGAMVSDRFGVRSFGLVMGLLGPFTTLAALGPWIAGTLRDQLGTYELALQLCLVVALVAGAAIWLLRPVSREA